jgi:hypothetical protein
MRGNFRRSSLNAPRSGKSWESPAAKLIQNQILRNADPGDAQLVGRLMHSDDAALARVSRRREANRPPLDQYSTLIRLDNAGCDFGEGRFPSAVGAEKSDDLAAAKQEIDVIERPRRPKTLGNREEA